MRYLALGDSMSIDEYTGRKGGGAASQFAARLPATVFDDRARDGFTTRDVERVLATVDGTYDVITLTVGGNDLLQTAAKPRAPITVEAWKAEAEQIMFRVQRIVGRLVALAGSTGKIVLNTVYDPSDGDDEKLAEMGLPIAARAGLDAYNLSLLWYAELASPVVNGGLHLCDTLEIFFGHSSWSEQPYLTQMIEPNLAGATALAEEWLRLARA